MGGCQLQNRGLNFLKNGVCLIVPSLQSCHCLKKQIAENKTILKILNWSPWIRRCSLELVVWDDISVSSASGLWQRRGTGQAIHPLSSRTPSSLPLSQPGITVAVRDVDHPLGNIVVVCGHRPQSRLELALKSVVRLAKVLVVVILGSSLGVCKVDNIPHFSFTFLPSTDLYDTPWQDHRCLRPLLFTS